MGTEPVSVSRIDKGAADECGGNRLTEAGRRKENP